MNPVMARRVGGVRLLARASSGSQRWRRFAEAAGAAGDDDGLRRRRLAAAAGDRPPPGSGGGGPVAAGGEPSGGVGNGVAGDGDGLRRWRMGEARGKRLRAPPVGRIRRHSARARRGHRRRWVGRERLGGDGRGAQTARAGPDRDLLPTPVACELSGARSGGYDWATADPGKASCSLVLPSPMTPTSLSSRRRRPPLDAVNVGSGLA